jgi:hypothetical protein
MEHVFLHVWADYLRFMMVQQTHQIHRDTKYMRHIDILVIAISKVTYQEEQDEQHSGRLQVAEKQM